MTEQLAILEKLGLSDKEARTYVAILELGSASIKPIAGRAGLKRTSLYNFIDHLVELGLVSQVEIRGRMHYQANPPSRLVDLERERLKQVEQALPEFMGLFNLVKDKPRIHYFEGPEQIRNILVEEPKCKSEILAIWSGSDVFDLFGNSYLEEIERQRIAAGVRIRVVRVRDKDEPFEEFGEGTGKNRELRYAPEGVNFSLSVSVYDTGKVGFISSKKEGFGILIESPELAELMKMLFEAFWQTAKPASKR